MRQTLCQRHVPFAHEEVRGVWRDRPWGRIGVVTDPLLDLARLSGVPAAVAAAQDATDAILADRGRREIQASTSAAALLAGARASAELAGQRWLPGAVRLSAALLELAPLIRRSPGQFLAQAHLISARDLVVEEKLGAIVQSAERVQELCRMLTRRTKASAIVVAAVAHAEVVLADPFAAGDESRQSGGDGWVSGSSVVALAVEHAVLIDAGLDPRAALVPEAGHLPVSVYRQRLVDYSSGSVSGVRNWLLHCCDAVVTGAEQSPLTPITRFRPNQEKRP